jgi:LacI family transcriptional regulator
MLRQATIKDVAEHAGVHPSTVSRVLNNRRRMPISPETVARIKQAARDLNYTPHAAARALVGGRTQTIGLIWFELTDPSQAALAQDVQAQVEARGYHLIVSSIDRDGKGDSSYSRLINENRVDGILVIASTSLSPLVTQQLKSKSAVIVAAGPPPLPEATDVLTAWVTHDNRHGGRLLGAHLGALGHRHVGYIGASAVASHVSALRLQGLREGLLAGGAPATVYEIDAAENSFPAGRRAAARLLERHPDVTAVFAYNDRMAMAALQTFWRRGLRVPEQISVVGYGDLELADYTIPPLTTVDVPRQRIAERATDLLFRALAKEEIAVEGVVVEPELVVRGSTAAPRR